MASAAPVPATAANVSALLIYGPSAPPPTIIRANGPTDGKLTSSWNIPVGRRSARIRLHALAIGKWISETPVCGCSTVSVPSPTSTRRRRRRQAAGGSGW